MRGEVKNKKSIIQGAIMCFSIIIFLTACNTTSSRSVKENYSRISESKTFSQAMKFDSNDSFEKVELLLDIKQEEGTLSWEVIDPQGEERWQGNLTGEENFRFTKTFEPLVGQWDLYIEADNFKGEIEKRWLGEN